MEEKKSIKVSLKTYLVTMFLMLLVIGILLGYIMHTSKTIQAKLNTIDEYIHAQPVVKTEDVVEEKEENVENTVVEDVEEEEENVITEEITDENEISNTVVENATETKVEKEFTDEEVERVLEGYLNIFVGHGSPEGILNNLDLMSYIEAEKYKSDEENYKLTDIPYSLFESSIEEYTTLENFKKINGNKFVDIEFKDVDGKVAYFNGGWTGTEYEVHKISKAEDSLTATHKAEILRTAGDRKVVENIEFSIEENNGKCVISYCSI